MFQQYLPKPRRSFIVTTQLARIPMYTYAGWVNEDQSLSHETKLAQARTRGIWSG